MRRRFCLAMIGCSLAAVGALPALAALGEDVSSVSTDRVQMHAQLKGTTSAAGFSVQEIENPRGTVVREYVNPSGTVFAVSWAGPSKPDLRQLFGSYFQQYVNAANSVRRGAASRRHFEVTQPDLIVESNGRMRAFRGRAYVPSLMPPGVTPGDIS